jgi:hypothetical protein
MITIDPFPHPSRGRASESPLKKPTELGHQACPVEEVPS